MKIQKIKFGKRPLNFLSVMGCMVIFLMLINVYKEFGSLYFPEIYNFKIKVEFNVIKEMVLRFKQASVDANVDSKKMHTSDDVGFSILVALMSGEWISKLNDYVPVLGSNFPLEIKFVFYLIQFLIFWMLISFVTGRQSYLKNCIIIFFLLSPNYYIVFQSLDTYVFQIFSVVLMYVLMLNANSKINYIIFLFISIFVFLIF